MVFVHVVIGMLDSQALCSANSFFVVGTLKGLGPVFPDALDHKSQQVLSQQRVQLDSPSVELRLQHPDCWYTPERADGCLEKVRGKVILRECFQWYRCGCDEVVRCRGGVNEPPDGYDASRGPVRMSHVDNAKGQERLVQKQSCCIGMGAATCERAEELHHAFTCANLLATPRQRGENKTGMRATSTQINS